MDTSIKLEYTGENYEFDRTPPPIDSKNRTYQPYIPQPGLTDIVNLAIDLERPLLIDGEPGCGKTELAAAIAYEFTQKYAKYLAPGEYWPWDTWNVKSIELASDGLYIFDAIRKMQDAQMAGAIGKVDNIPKQAELLKRLQYDEQKETDIDKHPYIKLGKLGEALRGKYSAPIRPILLIDEIDKADADFPNDLLMELDKNAFEIRETGRKYPEKRTDGTVAAKPIVIITSNCERPLSDAFLRRCIYFNLKFPNPKQLTEIIKRRFPDFGKNSQPKDKDLIDTLIKTLETMRLALDGQPGVKKPGTSEILDLVKCLQRLKKEPTAAEILMKIEDIANDSSLLGILLKSKEAQDLFAPLAGEPE
jgi:MoxR-like ATPase